MARQVQLIACVACLCLACGVLLAGASWVGQPYSVTIANPITARNQSQSDSLTMTLEHDKVCDIDVSVAQAGDEVLRSSTDDTLTTDYMLTSSAIQGGGDATWVPSSQFVGGNYKVTGTGPSDITIWVLATSAPDRANDAGTYSAQVILTATWPGA